MSANKGKNTGPEVVVRRALWAEGLRGYRTHLRGVPGHPDIAFPKEKVAVLVNGCFWHRCPKCRLPLPKSHADYWRAKFARNAARDREKERELTDAGWSVITVWECQVRDDLRNRVGIIKEALNSR